jgi:hypothetical protein
MAWRSLPAVAARTTGGRDDQVVVEDVDEGLGQPADAGLVDRRAHDEPVGGGDPVDGPLHR